MRLNCKFLIMCAIFLFLGLIASGQERIAKSCDGCIVAPPDVIRNEIVCLSSKQLRKRTKYLAPLNNPKFALSKIRDKSVTVNIFINKDGKVIKSKSLKGHPLLRASGEQAARFSKFEPMKVDGEPVNMCGNIVFKWTSTK